MITPSSVINVVSEEILKRRYRQFIQRVQTVILIIKTYEFLKLLAN